MSTKIASLYAEISADTSKLDKGLTETKGKLQGAEQGLKKAGSAGMDFGKSLLGAVLPTVSLTTALAATVTFMKSSIHEASEAAKVDAKLGAVLKSTGGIAGITASQIDEMSTAKSRMTGIDDETIKNGAAVLATYTSIGKDVFPDAIQSAMDMSAVMGGPLQGSVEMIGKAMNVTAGDVTAMSSAMTALRRNGVRFTEEQKDQARQMIETGDIAGYQKLILKELQTEFGGAAQAMFEAGDKSEGLRNSWNNYKEVLGQGLLPLTQKFNTQLATIVDTVTENAQQNMAYNDSIEAVGKMYGWTDKQIAGSIQHHGRMSEQMENQVNEYMRLQQYGAAWEKTLSSQGNTAAQDYALMLKGGLSMTKMLSGFSQETAKVEDFFADKKKVRTLYKQDQAELKQQLDAGLITMKQYNQAIYGMQVAWENGTFAIQKQGEAVKELEAAQNQEAASYMMNLLAQTEGTEQIQYEYAKETGLITAGAAQQAQAFDKINNAMVKHQLTAKKGAEVTKLFANDMAALRGLSVETFIDVYIRTHGDTNLALAAADKEFSKNRKHGGVIGDAGGGQLDGRNWTIVGDRRGGGLTPYSEAISPDGTVFNAETTKWMYENGFLGDAIKAAGGGGLKGASALDRIKRSGGNVVLNRPASTMARSKVTSTSSSPEVAADTGAVQSQLIDVAKQSTNTQTDVVTQATQQQTGVLNDILAAIKDQPTKRDARNNARAAQQKSV